VGSNNNSAYAHLRYGLIKGYVYVKRKRFTITYIGQQTLAAGQMMPEIYEVKTEKHMYRHHRHSKIKGKKITGSVARKMNRTYGTTLTHPRYKAVLQTVASNPQKQSEELARGTALPVSATYAHLRFGELIGDIRRESKKYWITNQGVESLSKLQNQDAQKITKETPEQTERKAYPTRLEGTIIKDKDALFIHTTYGSPIIAERCKKIKGLLEGAVLFRRSVQELAEQTGWSNNSVFCQLLYGIKQKEIKECGAYDNKKNYCLAKFYDKVIKPEETKIQSRSWIDENKDKGEGGSLWRSSK
jgi:hypothetical protein